MGIILRYGRGLKLMTLTPLCSPENKVNTTLPLQKEFYGDRFSNIRLTLQEIRDLQISVFSLYTSY